MVYLDKMVHSQGKTLSCGDKFDCNLEVKLLWLWVIRPLLCMSPWTCLSYGLLSLQQRVSIILEPSVSVCVLFLPFFHLCHFPLFYATLFFFSASFAQYRSEDGRVSSASGQTYSPTGTPILTPIPSRTTSKNTSSHAAPKTGNSRLKIISFDWKKNCHFRTFF